MTDRTKLGLEVLQASVLLGILGDAMLRATPWGLNVFLWVTGVSAAMIALHLHWRPAALRLRDLWLYLPLPVFSLSMAWRDSATLHAFDILALLSTFGLLTLRASGLPLMRASLTRTVLGYFATVGNVCFGPFALFLSDIKWAQLPSNGWSKHLAAVFRGLVIAMPILLVFGALLAAADAVFAGFFKNSIHLDPGVVVGHLFLGLFLAWIAGGFLRGVALGENGEFAYQPSAKSPIAKEGPLSLDLSNRSVTNDGPEPSTANPEGATATAATETKVDVPPARLFSLGIVEVCIILGLVNILFLGFVIVQVRYLFGGAELVQSTIGLNYAEYARRGFFELVTVAMLVLPILLAVHWLLTEGDARLQKMYRVLAAVQILLLFVIMASAFKRMMIYQGGYGLTELRIYTTAFMGWLALVFIWFSVTVLRGRREAFVGGAVVAAFVVLFGLHVVNPDALIVQVNTAQAANGKIIDTTYLTTLSDDAMPTLLEAVPALTPSDRCLVARSLLARRTQMGATDWRSWNWGRSRSRHRIDAATEGLKSFGCEATAPTMEPSPTDRTTILDVPKDTGD
jgi:hypothetical protein